MGLLDILGGVAQGELDYRARKKLEDAAKEEQAYRQQQLQIEMLKAGYTPQAAQVQPQIPQQIRPQVGIGQATLPNIPTMASLSNPSQMAQVAQSSQPTVRIGDTNYVSGNAEKKKRLDEFLVNNPKAKRQYSVDESGKISETYSTPADIGVLGRGSSNLSSNFTSIYTQLQTAKQQGRTAYLKVLTSLKDDIDSLPDNEQVLLIKTFGSTPTAPKGSKPVPQIILPKGIK